MKRLVLILIITLYFTSYSEGHESIRVSQWRSVVINITNIAETSSSTFEFMNTRGFIPAAFWRGETGRIRSSQINIRPTTSRSLEDCVIKDSAHYKRKLSMKITQVRGELFAMNDEIKELSANEKKMEYHAKQAQVKAKELTELQGLLSDHFTALDKASMRVTKAEIDKETAKLKEQNDSLMREQEDIYDRRVNLELNEEKLKKELLSMISNTAQRDGQQKCEQIKMELQLYELDKQTESLMENSMLEYKDTSYCTSIESDLGLLRAILGNTLNEVANSIFSASKLEQYHKMVSENHMDRVQSCSPQRMMQYLDYYLSRLLTIDKYVTGARKQLTAKYLDVKRICVESLNISSLCDVLGRRITDLKSEISIIECQRQTARDKLNREEAELRANEKQLMGNETNKQLQELENKLRNVNRINYSIKEYREEGKSLGDLHECKERVLNRISRLNAMIVSNLNQ